MINHREFTIAYLGLCLLRYDAEPFALCGLRQNDSFVRNQTDSFLRYPYYRACILPNIRRKNRRDIDGTLGTSALRFQGIALCVAKPLESSVLECRHITFNSKV